MSSANNKSQGTNDKTISSLTSSSSVKKKKRKNTNKSKQPSSNVTTKDVVEKSNRSFHFEEVRDSDSSASSIPSNTGIPNSLSIPAVPLISREVEVLPLTYPTNLIFRKLNLHVCGIKHSSTSRFFDYLSERDFNYGLTEHYKDPRIDFNLTSEEIVLYYNICFHLVYVDACFSTYEFINSQPDKRFDNFGINFWLQKFKFKVPMASRFRERIKDFPIPPFLQKLVYDSLKPRKFVLNGKLVFTLNKCRLYYHKPDPEVFGDREYLDLTDEIFSDGLTARNTFNKAITFVEELMFNYDTKLGRRLNAPLRVKWGDFRFNQYLDWSTYSSPELFGYCYSDIVQNSSNYILQGIYSIDGSLQLPFRNPFNLDPELLFYLTLPVYNDDDVTIIDSAEISGKSTVNFLGGIVTGSNFTNEYVNSSGFISKFSENDYFDFTFNLINRVSGQYDYFVKSYTFDTYYRIEVRNYYNQLGVSLYKLVFGFGN